MFVTLGELIGERQINLALKEFLNSFRYSNSQPTTIDLLNHILKVIDHKHHSKIRALFG